MVIERKHRLPREFYKGKVRCTFTLCIKDRVEFFIEERIINIFNEMLSNEVKDGLVINWVYMYMPDHLHLVLEGKSEESDLWKVIVSFKQKTGYWLSKNMNEYKWQKGFYDHIHRKEEDLKKHISYVLNNPVRKGIVANWNDYKFKGSLNFELNEIV